MKIEANSTNPRVSELYKQMRDGSLVLQPAFQRKFVWTSKHQEEFIDTILKGYPFPEVYVCDGDIDTVTFDSKTLVIDGQQRLTTIKRYIENVDSDDFKTIKKYADLSKDEIESFLSYKVVVRNVGSVDNSTVREIFRRINLTKFKLDSIEIQNAIYDGEFIATAKLILEGINMSSYKVLKDSELDRMADLHYVLLVMSTVENGGYFSKDSELESYIERYNDHYENKDKLSSLLIDVFSFVDNMNLPSDSAFFRKSNFFTLLVELCLYTLAKEKETGIVGVYNHIGAPQKLAALLNVFSNDLYAKKDTESPYTEYYSCMYQGTNNRTSRVTRSTIFRDMIFSAL